MMRDDDISSDRQCGGDVAAYALGALSADEAEAFRHHLETCAVCRDELSAYEEVVSVLPLGAPVNRAPAGLRRRVMREVRADGRGRSAAPTAPTAPARAAGWRTTRRPGVPSWRPAPVLAALLALAAIGFGADRLAAGGGPSARLIHAQVAGQGSAELRLAAGHVDLIVHNFSPPPAGEIYEVWLQRPGGAPAPTTALFSVNAAGTADVDVPGSLHGISRVMVTPEPNGGSKVPTHPAVISVPL